MLDFSVARKTMVDCQVRVNDVTSPALIDALLAVARESFVPEHRKAFAYIDADVCVSADDAAPRFLMAPMVLAKLLNAAAIVAGERVLDIGAATGYSSALLAKLGADVTTLESDAALATQAKGLLGNAVVEGPMPKGAQDKAPFDAIVLQGAVAEVPDTLKAQLAIGGRLIAVVGEGRFGRATLIRRVGDAYSEQILFDAAVPVLPGFEKAPSFQF